MKINNSTPPEQLRPVDRARVNATDKTAQAKNPSQLGSTAQLQQTSGSQDIDSARVNEIKEAIREGRLDIRTDRISQGLIDSVRSMLDED